MKRNLVLFIIITTFFCIIGWDILLYCDDVEGNSITQVIIWASGKSHLVPFGIGFLFGALAVHFFEGGDK